jgi:hypothetical protein
VLYTEAAQLVPALKSYWLIIHVSSAIVCAGAFTVAGAGKPGAPTGVTAVRSANGSVAVSWTAPTDNGGSAITGYTVEFETESAGATCNASVRGWNDGSVTAGGSATSATETGLDADWYCVRVSASNGVSSGSTSYGYAGPVYSAVSKPGAPTITSVTASGTSLVVAFTPPASDGGAPITRYEYSTDDGDEWRSASGTTSPITITGDSDEGDALQRGVTYEILLRAENEAGEGSESSMVEAVLPDVPGKPGKPVMAAGRGPASAGARACGAAPAFPAEAAADFLARHVSIDPARPAVERMADAIIEILRARSQARGA